MHDAMIYLQDPAHPELPERAQPPSALRPLVQSPLFPDGGDVIRWLGQQVTGPGTGRHKLRVRFKKKERKKDLIFVWATQLKESSPYLRLQRVQPVAHGCDSTAVETIWEESTKKPFSGWALNSACVHTCCYIVAALTGDLSCARWRPPQHGWFSDGLLSHKLVPCICTRWWKHRKLIYINL